jgi:hypothetical protein
MVAHVRAVSPSEYEQFIARRKRDIAAGNREAARQRNEQREQGQEPDNTSQEQQ